MFKKILDRIKKSSTQVDQQPPASIDESAEVDDFTRTYKVFLDNLIQIFYPIKLEWYEILSMIILGVLMGLGLGVLIGYIVKHVVI